MIREIVIAWACGILAAVAIGLAIHCTPLVDPVVAKDTGDSGWHTATTPPGFDAGNGALR